MSCCSCDIYNSLDELRESRGYHEKNGNTWIKGLGPKESRMLYHKLLANLPCLVHSEKYQNLSICEKAHKAYVYRKLSKQYVRQQSYFWITLAARIYDFARHQRFDGQTVTKLWNKKAKQIEASRCMISNESETINLWNDANCEDVCSQILESSIKTNKFVDNIIKTNEQEYKYELEALLSCVLIFVFVKYWCFRRSSKSTKTKRSFHRNSFSLDDGRTFCRNTRGDLYYWNFMNGDEIYLETHL